MNCIVNVPAGGADIPTFLPLFNADRERQVRIVEQNLKRALHFEVFGKQGDVPDISIRTMLPTLFTSTSFVSLGILMVYCQRI
jgi:hypothetical protein